MTGQRQSRRCLLFLLAAAPTASMDSSFRGGWVIRAAIESACTFERAYCHDSRTDQTVGGCVAKEALEAMGTYLSGRAWGTVREDYSPDGDAWEYFPHDHARSRAYRWNEDGLAGICDRHQFIGFAVALWNERDSILKERLFGLTSTEGNHGEDVKEQYFYLDDTPTHSYMKYLYKYPTSAFPYARLVDQNRRRGKSKQISSCLTLEHSMTTVILTCSSSTPRLTLRTY